MHKESYRKQHPAAVEGLISSTYVDDLLESQPTLKDVQKVEQGAIDILGCIGVELVRAAVLSKRVVTKVIGIE